MRSAVDGLRAAVLVLTVHTWASSLQVELKAASKPTTNLTIGQEEDFGL